MSTDVQAGAPLLPLHLSLTGRRVVAAGGGPVAWRKVQSALEAGAAVTVVAPYVCDELAEAAAAGAVAWLQRDYRAGDLAGAWLAVAATGDADTDLLVEADADLQQTFCIRASTLTAEERSGSRTRSPAVLRRAGLTISVASDTGADPRRPRAVRDAIALAMDTGELPLRRHRGEMPVPAESPWSAADPATRTS